MKICSVCGETVNLAIGRTILCSKPSCSIIHKAIDNKMRKDRLKSEVLKEGKVCGRCQSRVHEEGMKKYCTECKEILNMKKCKTCKRLIQSPKTYCDDCREQNRVDAIKKQTVHRKKKRAKEKAVKAITEKEETGISEKFLRRGAIGNSSRFSNLG